MLSRVASVYSRCFEEDLAGVDEEDLALALPAVAGLGLVQDQHDAGGGGVVEEVFGQVEEQAASQIQDSRDLDLSGLTLAVRRGAGERFLDLFILSADRVQSDPLDWQAAL